MTHADSKGGAQLVVRNTFLELFDDTPALGLAEEGAGRRPRAHTDVTDKKLPQKVKYPVDDSRGALGGALPSGSFPSMPEEGAAVLDSDGSSFVGRPGAVMPMAPYHGFDPASMAGAGMQPWWDYAGGAAGISSYAGGQAGYYPSWGYPGYAVSPATASETAAYSCPSPQPKASEVAAYSNPGPSPGHSGAQRQAAPRERKAKEQGGRGGKATAALQTAPTTPEQSAGAARGKGGNPEQGAGAARGKGSKASAAVVPDAGSAGAAAAGAAGEAPNTDTATTVMLRNIPNRYTQTMMLTMLDENGFKARYDFVYMPMDFRNGVNLGYAFVNLLTHQDALELMSVFEGFSSWFFDNAKVCEVSWAHPHQGYAEHVERYRNSPVMHPCMPEEYKPMVFQRGLRMPFPPPTKQIRAPKLRPVRDKGDKAAAEA